MHHFKNLRQMMSEINRVSIAGNLEEHTQGTFLIIREHDVTDKYTQPYLDFIHLLELIKKDLYDYDQFYANYYKRSDLRHSLESNGWVYVDSVDYPASQKNPQRLYSSIFMYTGSSGKWLTPINVGTEYRIDNDKLFQYIRNISNSEELNNYVKVLFKHKIYKGDALRLLRSRNNTEFTKNFLQLI
jgi:hypothetical protein